MDHRTLKEIRKMGVEWPAHKKKMVKDYVAGAEGRLTLHFLPGYAPELNPDELMWSHAKRTGNARHPLCARGHRKETLGLGGITL